jgi:hypothetical protein
MTLEGGAVLFIDEVLKDENNIRKIIYSILKDSDTSIEIIALNDTRTRGQDFSCIFKIKFNKKFDTNFKNISNTIYNIKAPRVLIIKLLIGYPYSEVENEMSIHKTLGSQTTMLPICPSFLFHQEINNDEMMTTIGAAFYDLLKLKADKEHYTEFCDFIKNKDPKTSKQVQNIFVMEFIECISYTEFYETTLKNNAGKKLSKKSFYKYTILDESIKLSSANKSEELQNFFTYYMTSLLAIKGFHHSDIHSDNIMICSNIEEKKSEQQEDQLNTERTTIFPFVIDFGRAGRINKDELVFRELHLKGYGRKKLKLDDLSVVPYFDTEQYLRPIYLNAVKNKTNIVDYVNRLLTEENYVDAVLTISMCINPKSGLYPPIFQGFYDFKHQPYADLYFINEARKIKYNSIISQLIQKRNLLEKQLPEEREQQIMRDSIALSHIDPPYSGLNKIDPRIVSNEFDSKEFVDVDGGKLILRRKKKSIKKRSIKKRSIKKRSIKKRSKRTLN